MPGGRGHTERDVLAGVEVGGREIVGAEEGGGAFLDDRCHGGERGENTLAGLVDQVPYELTETNGGG